MGKIMLEGVKNVGIHTDVETNGKNYVRRFVRTSVRKMSGDKSRRVLTDMWGKFSKICQKEV